MAATVTEDAKLLPADGAADDDFGRSVSVSGDTAIVGAYFADVVGNSDQGAAYVFVRSGGTWTGQQNLTASDGAADDLFGWSVSVSGDTAVVGTIHGDGSVASSGSAYVFVRSGSTWTEQAKLTASDGATDDWFGSSVSLNGDTVVVGAHYDDDNGLQSGSAYVFVRSGSTWTEQAKLRASDGAVYDYFGHSVSVSGGTVVVGAHGDDDNGSSYVFERSGSAWTEEAKLTASDGAVWDDFGWSVSVSGDTAVVGTDTDTDGSAYVFVRTGSSPSSTWSEQAKLSASDGAAWDNFGWSVSVSGDTAVVGAYWADGSVSASGGAYVFVRSGSLWTEQAKLTASDGAAGDDFGRSVSVSGETVVVGAPHDNDNGSNSGSAYVFEAPWEPAVTPFAGGCTPDTGSAVVLLLAAAAVTFALGRRACAGSGRPGVNG
jgi:hypothetical protein